MLKKFDDIEDRGMCVYISVFIIIKKKVQFEYTKKYTFDRETTKKVDMGRCGQELYSTINILLLIFY